MTQPLPDYVIVSPVKDEADYLPVLADSIIAQRHRPLEWVIVDDGSNDGTPQIAARYASEYPWIRLVERPPSTAPRSRGAAVVDAFEVGRALASDAGELIVKLDGDLYVPPHYFEWIAATFRDEPRTGIVGGLVLNDNGQRWEFDTINMNTVPGATKCYRRACLADIGGLPRSMGWDGIDEYAARARGWDVHTLSELQVLHYKPRGSKQSWHRARWEEGHANHFMGYRPAFMLVRVVFRSFVERPPLAAALVMGASYLWHAVVRAPRTPDKLAVRQLRKEQTHRLRNMLALRKERSLWSTTHGPAHRTLRSGDESPAQTHDYS